MSDTTSMTPQSDPEAVTTERAMKIDYLHVCQQKDQRVDTTIYFPINDGIWIPMNPQCADCGESLMLLTKEIVGNV